jgi:hypothetical protein
MYRLEARKWAQGDQAVRQRMLNHLRLTDVPADQDDGICALQLRCANEVLRTFGAAL